VCPTDATCTNSQCRCPADRPLLNVGGTACVAECGPTEIEQGGRCVSCGAGQTACQTSGNAEFCTNTLADEANCGACGNACNVDDPSTPTSEAEFCQAGTCTPLLTCGEGQVPVNNVCTPCAPGTIPNQDKTECVACPAGQVQPLPGQTSCQACPKNAIPNAGQTACTECPAGQQANTGGTGCEKCQPGTVREPGQPSCHACTAPEVPNADQTACVPPTPTP
jgi:hypothetical protein